MASAAVLESKKQIVNALTDRLKGSVAGVLVDFKGINVADDTKLRRELRDAGVEYNVVKNTLIRLAAKNAELDGLDSYLEGTTALATSKDDVLVCAKMLSKFAKDHPDFKIKAGYSEGQVLDENGVKALADVPSKEQSLVGFMFCIQSPVRNLAVVLNQYAEKLSAPEA